MELFTIVPKFNFGSNCYVIKNNDSWAVIDPSASIEEIKDKIPSLNSEPSFVLITHAHFDHIYSIDGYAKRAVPVYVGIDDANSLNDPYYNCYRIFMDKEKGYNGSFKTLEEGDLIELSGIEIKVLETPGHTKGSVSFIINECAFVGDLLFEGGGYGRFDLPGGDRTTLFKSIEKFYKAFPHGIIYSGHGSPFSI